jgi:hypothetical protein
MDTQLLCEKFGRLGARVKVDRGPGVAGVAIDVRSDRRGEYFDLRVPASMTADALDVRARERHLLLAVRDETAWGAPAAGAGQRYLCGHDERAWFVAAVPGGRGASNVALAMDALKPREVHRAIRDQGLRAGKRNRRKTAAFVRQGEWFFVPAPRWTHVPEAMVLRDEPLARTGGKPHRAEFAYRSGGELVYVHSRTGRVISAQQHAQLVRDKPGEAPRYRPQRQNMSVLVRGRISHADHKTIVLRGWHSVHMNTENQSEAMRYVSFID